MSSPKITSALVEQIARLNAKGDGAKEIALSLGLKRLQVTALLAHLELKSHEEQHSERSSAEPSDYVREEGEPFPAAEVAKFQVDAIDEQPEAKGGIYVGEDREYPDAQYWSPADTQLSQNPHLMIIGESGSGKTYATQCLIAELAQAGIPSVVFDYGQGFETETLDKQFLKHNLPQEHLIGENGLAINPLEIFPKDSRGPNTVAARVADVFDAVYRLGDIQRKVLIDAMIRLFANRGIEASNQKTWQKEPPTLGDLQAVLGDLAADKHYPSNKNAQTVEARLTTFFMLNSFQNEGTPWAWNKLIADPKHRVHILQFRGLEGRTQRVVVELLLWHLFFYLKSEGQQGLRLYCVLDEAHHLSFRDGGPVDSLLREARKFGLGLIFASQQPGDFSPAAYSNSASKLVFQTTDPDLRVSKFLASKCSNYDTADQVHEIIASLPQGEAFFITANRGKTVKITDFNKRATLWKQYD
jgi:DNA phosphorothioation-dependent restriction protein DptH